MASPARGSFPYRHPTLAEIASAHGGGLARRLFCSEGEAPVAETAEALAPAQPTAAPAPCVASGPERHIALRDAARAHLKACGFFVQRKSLNDPVPEWSVSHFNGWFSDHELIRLAMEYGLKAGAVAHG